MALEKGSRLGPYDIVAFLGAGGMGEVYEAVDTRLNRRVALKVLLPGLSLDDERRRRFLQEAQLASSLQHPHIVTIYDIGSSDGAEYLAMELVRGRTLDSAIPHWGFRLGDALRYAIQITDALAAAHAAGIVHRDLKPGNIMVTDQDQIKILDFGLATLVTRGLTGAGDETRMQSAIGMDAGTILGTIAYMSPEQAEGKKVDERSDIFSFGAILYEMLSGQRAFRAESTPATLAAVINAEPRPLAKLAEGVPQAVDRLVSRCLRKDLARRAQHASDIKVTLEELREDSTSGALADPASVRPRRPWLVPTIASAVVALGAMAAFHWWPTRDTSLAPSLATPFTALPGREDVASFSPDGTQVAFSWQPDPASGPDVYVQMTNGTGTRLRLSNDGSFRGFPAWAPNGKTIALWRQSPARQTFELVLISPLGGPERELLDWPNRPSAIAWSPDSQWLVVSPVSPRADLNRGLLFVSPVTGEQVDWSALDPAFVGSAEPAFSPDGRRLAYTRTTGDFTGELNIVAVGADGKPAGRPEPVAYKSRELHNPVWTADGRGLLIIEGSSSSNGGVVRIPLDTPQRAQRIPGLDHAESIALSSDGTRLLFARGGINSDIWRIDLRDPSKSGPIAQSTLWDGGGEYSPDGTRLAFGSNRGGARELWVSDASGENAQPLTSFNGPVPGTSRWSPDSRQLVFDGRPDNNSDIFVVSASGGPVRQLTRTPGEDARPAWSVDGRSIFFCSDRSGQPEIWRMDADGGHPAQITRHGGSAALAALDGRHLIYKRSADTSRIREIGIDGTGDRELVPEPAFAVLPFAVTARGIWFVAPSAGHPHWSIRLQRQSDHQIVDMAKFEGQPDGLALSISPDERYALVTKQDISGTDLLLVNDFR